MEDVSVDPERIIRVMPDTLANKIAAGEVVQRPASALKEMIENAIDAGGDEVQVILKDAGSTLIQVIDDGSGMSALDAVQCFQRHATSKITSIDDLERIRTLGFRGEALASISAVAQVELKTRRMQDAAGIRVRIDGGEVGETVPCAAPGGTSLAVRNLFYNVPARRNFLKTPATEFKHLVETFQFLALSNPRVAFSLVHDDNEVYRLTAPRTESRFGALKHRIRELFGADHADHLVPIEETTSYLSVWGFASVPEFNRRSRGEQFLFVNNRFVKNRYLEHAVTGAYGDMLPEGAYPFFTLFLDIDPRHVDVNVHPTKAEVKFDDERGLYSFIKTVIRKGLGAVDLTPQFEEESRATASDGPAMPTMPRARAASLSWGQPETPSERRGATFASGFGGRSERHAASLFTASSRPSFETPHRDGLPSDLAPGALSARLYDSGEETPEPERVDAQASPSAVWQVGGTYLVQHVSGGLMVIDQNAAHERILYERARASMDSDKGASQQLLFPHTIDFGPAEYALLQELLPDLQALGFDVELFSGRSVVVRGVPADVRGGHEQTVLDDLLQQYKSFADSLQVRGREAIARSMARRNAVRKGAPLSAEEMAALVRQLFACEMPYACPSGRPTLIKIPAEELEKRFRAAGVP